ncbi:MAG: fumarylacetoacetate hydrolase [Verrucomicrobia bacterium]|nr:MAG: fumarylacetoacetate hydrolase [Verrucomicrobiota bacterium]
MSTIFCRYRVAGESESRVGLVTEGRSVIDLREAGVRTLTELLEDEMELVRVTEWAQQGSHPELTLADVTLLPPVERQEVWAAGVTYLRSKKARMEESDHNASAYDRVYDAPRPELFFKSMPEKVVGPNDFVGIRRDAGWNVPEPELALIINSQGQLRGYTIGNDMSSRDIEGENTLYLPQAKIYDRSCALGPWMVVGATEEEAREWEIGVSIERGGEEVFCGSTKVGQIKRTFDELMGYLLRSQTFPHGVILFTGTGVVPEDSFTLQQHDIVRMKISGIGVLENQVTVV